MEMCHDVFDHLLLLGSCGISVLRCYIMQYQNQKVNFSTGEQNFFLGVTSRRAQTEHFTGFSDSLFSLNITPIKLKF